MKALKMKELRQKIEKIGREGGVDIDPEGMFCFTFKNKHSTQNL